MTPTTLLAKSRRKDRTLSLEKHLIDTEEAAVHIFRQDRRWGEAFLRFFKVRKDQRSIFLLNLRIACLFHDIGKANQGFYQAVTCDRFFRQVMRHEHLSGLFLHLPEVRTWLVTNKDLDLEVITAAVLSHHVKVSQADGDWPWGVPWSQPESVQVYFQHPEVQRILAKISNLAGLPTPPDLLDEVWSLSEKWGDILRQGRKAATQFRRSIRVDLPRRSFLLAMKAAVIAADSAASGLWSEEYNLEAWLGDITTRSEIRPQDIDQGIIYPRIRSIPTWNGFHRFQVEASKLGPRALLLSGCGSGKTLAAWMWAKEQVSTQKIGSVVFLYPTCDTATEGFRDYVAGAPEDEAVLMHERAKYELRAMRENPSEPDGNGGKNFETEDRLRSLGAWPRRYFSATVDRFLGFMGHSYDSLCMLPVLADSAVIIDEVHSFDKHLFDVLISFLKSFDVPVLCMTASLSSDRKTDLIEAGLRVYPTNDEQVKDLKRNESRPRYLFEEVEGEDQALVRATQAFKSGQRVLWVVNRVKSCQRVAIRLRETIGDDVICYHGRFRLKDRRQHQQRVIQTFRPGGRPAIAITTQVCEMSLDLDADVLITEVAPPTSIIQRLGRANRHLRLDNTFRSPVLFYKGEKSLPYTRDEVLAGYNLMASMVGGDISQSDLAEALTRHTIPERIPKEAGTFLSGGYYATRNSIRRIQDFTRTCILDTDVPEAQKIQSSGKSIDEYMIDIPEGDILPIEVPKGLPSFLRLAAGDRYDQWVGFLSEEFKTCPLSSNTP